MAIEVSGCHLVLVICGQQRGRRAKGHSRRTAQTGIDGPDAP
jgi:hypothetical protein